MTLRTLIARPSDTVAIALTDLPAGDEVEGVRLNTAIPSGHKFALHPHDVGDAVVKLGQPIGVATNAIMAGDHVHSHNLAFAGGTSQKASQATALPAPREAGFQGFIRANGKVGTRNYIGILCSVNCSATVARKIADHFTPERLADYPMVDGVVAFSHLSGCGMASSGTALANLQRTLEGYAHHPNFAAILLVGLGCEVNQSTALAERFNADDATVPVAHLTIQEEGGTLAAISAGIAAVEALLPAANAVTREPVSAAHITLGLQCGASDGYSGITANPVLGAAADLLVAAGGKVILSETPEIYGAEELLLARAAEAQVAGKLRDKIRWWENYASADGANLDNNPSPGNKAGGITTILEKSLGAVAKSGSSPLVDVVDYAEAVTKAGLSFMDTPGYDPCSATGQIAGGANLILFTTGRGSTFGSKPAPTLKLATTSALARRMADDIDFDCGPVLDGVSIEALGEELFACILDCASGAHSRSEQLGLGDNEFVPWLPGATY